MTNNDALVRLLRLHDDELRQSPLRLSGDLRIRRSLAGATDRAHVGPWSLRRSLVVAFALVLAVTALLLRPIATSRDDAGGRLATDSPLSDSERSAATPATPGVTGTGHPTIPNAESHRGDLTGTKGCTIVHGEGGRVSYVGRCASRLGGVAISTIGPSRFEHTENGVTVVQGECHFRVAPRRRGDVPVRITVSGGVIEVVGTEFVIKEGSSGGSVHLLSGHIRFVSSVGPPIVLEPGEELTWKRATPLPNRQGSERAPQDTPRRDGYADEPTAAPDTAAADGAAAFPDAPRRNGTTSTRSASPAPNGKAASPGTSNSTSTQAMTERTIAKVVELRSRGRYAEAIRLLTNLSSQTSDPRTSETISFEHGNALEHLGDDEASCRHWRRHLTSYPTGRYSHTVRDHVQTLCATPEPPPSASEPPAIGRKL